MPSLFAPPPRIFFPEVETRPIRHSNGVTHWQKHVHHISMSFSFLFYMRQCSRSDQERHRAEVLALDRLDPRPTNKAIARSVGVAPSTVRYILKQFRDRGDQLMDRPRTGRSVGQNLRWRRFVTLRTEIYAQFLKILLTGT